MVSVSERITEHAHDAVGALGRLRRVWPWLGDAREPGRPAAHLLLERRLTPAAERIENEQVRRDRRAKHAALQDGKVPPGPQPAPVRLGAVRARSTIAARIRGVGGRVHAVLPARLADPTLRRPTRRCGHCAGSGRQAPAGWPWPLLAPTCTLCGGWGAICGICGTTGDCYCDLADVVVEACLDAIATAVITLPNPAAAADAADRLNATADFACTTLGLRDVDLRVIKAPCPACDRRDLWADVASPRRTEWSVSCRSALCVCTGPGCGCGRPVRWAGRRHRWPAAEFNALAEQLGVRATTLLG